MTQLHNNEYDLFNTFVVEVELGSDHNYFETHISLITSCAETAISHFNTLPISSNGGRWDYATVRIKGSVMNVAGSTRTLDHKNIGLEPSCFDIFDFDADPAYGTDKTAGGINISDDASSPENSLYSQLLCDEAMLSQKGMLKTNLSQIDLSILRLN